GPCRQTGGGVVFSHRGVWLSDRPLTEFSFALRCARHLSATLSLQEQLTILTLTSTSRNRNQQLLDMCDQLTTAPDNEEQITLLAVEVDDAYVLPYECVEKGKQFCEFLVPSHILNQHAIVTRIYTTLQRHI